MVEVKSLGQNTVTFKGNQMIVSGPEIAQAQQIANQLSTGAAKLATLNGKHVLILTQPTVINQAQKLHSERQIGEQFQENDGNVDITNNADVQSQILDPEDETGMESNKNIQQGKKRKCILNESSDYAGGDEGKKCCYIQKSAAQNFEKTERSSRKENSQ